MAKDKEPNESIIKLIHNNCIGVNGVSRSMISLIEIAKTDITVSKLKIIADNLSQM